MNTSFRFGQFLLNPATRQLLVDDRPAVLGARALDVLCALVERRDRLVTKEELLELAWPGLVVEENNLQVQISALRKILGANAIATIPGRGYRFTLELAAPDAPPAAFAANPHNLPQPLTSFIGHEDDLSECAGFLRETRLLTLTGIGGCGKTRLALKLAETVLPSFPDGVWFVDLASMADAERLPLTVATTLRIRKPADQHPLDALRMYLADRRLLLILDNCEHLIGACTDLVRNILGATRDVRVLVTSREGLGVSGERTVTVRSLALPLLEEDTHDMEALLAIESVRLFVDRARLADSKFVLDARTAPAVAEIARRLDGIPLAIELAAARARVLSADEIRARLSDRFRLLSGGRPGAVSRQNTLLAAIQWSYDHLAPDEQKLLRALSVFAGGWSLDSAVRVTGEGADEYELLDLLTRLVERSLVTIDRIAGETRYGMLETVRHYAQEQLERSGDGATTRERHLAFFVALVEEAAPHFTGPGQKLWLDRIKADLENILQALAWCDKADDGTVLAMRLASALLRFWYHSGLMEVGHRELSIALARGTPVRNNLRARTLMAAGHLGSNLDLYATATEQISEVLSIAREIGDEGLVVDALVTLGYLDLESGNTTQAIDLLQEALAIARSSRNTAQVGPALSAIGEAYRASGDMGAALAYCEESLAMARAQRDPDRIATACDNLARVLIPLGQSGSARDLVVEVLSLTAEAGSKWTALCAFDITAALAAIARDWTFAARMRGVAEARVTNLKFRRDRADDAFLAPWTLLIRETLGEDSYRSAYDSGFALVHESAVSEAFEWLNRQTDLGKLPE